MGDYNPYRLSRVRPSAPRKREYPEWGKLLAEVVDPAEHWFALVYGEAHHIEQYGIEITEDILRNILLRFHEDWMKQLESMNKRDRDLEREREISIVYYMRIGDRVKIGTTTNLKRRRAEINPEELMATEPGWYDRDGVHQTIKPVDHKGRHNAARYWLRDLQRAEYDTRESEWSQRAELVTA